MQVGAFGAVKEVPPVEYDQEMRIVDSWLIGTFAFPRYQAGAHGCTYRDGRAERCSVGGEFDREIVDRRVFDEATLTLR